MPQALISINAVTGSNPPNGTALAINTLIQLNNTNSGGEVSYLWEFLDRPEGSTATFSSAVVQNPTFTPDCEGTYLIRLTVNAALATESVNTVIAAISQMKSGIRIPAAGETTEESTARGWAEDVNRGMQMLDNVRADAGLVTGYAGAAFARGSIVRISGMTLIKAGLPDEEYIPTFLTALATNASHMVLPLYIVQNLIDGGTSVLANNIFFARDKGICGPVATLGGVAGDRVYVSDTATLSLTPGTNPRRVGTIAYTDGATYDWIYFDGGMVHGESTINLEDGSRIAQRNGNLQIDNDDTNSDILVETLGTGTIGIVAGGPFEVTAGTNAEITAGADVLITATDDASIAVTDDITLSAGGGAVTLGLDGGLAKATFGPTARVVSGVATPSATTDAANKGYVDTAVGAVPLVNGYVFFGNTATPNASTECAIDPGFCDRTAPLSAASHPTLPICKSGTLRDLQVAAVTGPAGASLDLTVWLNGAPTTITCTLAIAGTSASDHSNSVAVAAGDLIELRAKSAGVITTGAVDISAMLRIAGS